MNESIFLFISFARWSFGILLWEMFTLGQTPYPSIPVQHLVALLKECGRMEKPDYCPVEIYHIMLQCWNENPKERSSFDVLYAKLQKLLQVNVIEVRISSIWRDNSLYHNHAWQNYCNLIGGEVFRKLPIIPCALNVQGLGFLFCT